jgi:hypothetical protein
MKNKRVYEITLHLADIEHFFCKPDISPFSHDYREYSYTSGIEYLAKELYASPTSQGLHVILLLPPDKIEPGLEQRTQEAVLRYCSARVKEIEQDIRGLRRHALQALLLALAGLVIFIGLGGEMTGNASIIIRLLGQGLIVLGWVFVWFPLDSIVFGTQYSHQDSRIYKKLITMQFTLKSCE